MVKANQDLRSTAKSAGVCLWEVADAMGMRDSEFSRKLRRELPDTEKEKIRSIIGALKAGVVNA